MCHMVCTQVREGAQLLSPEISAVRDGEAEATASTEVGGRAGVGTTARSVPSTPTPEQRLDTASRTAKITAETLPGMKDAEGGVRGDGANAALGGPKTALSRRVDAFQLPSEHELHEETEKKYNEINAKTMYNMVEQIGNQRLFFMTNRQAQLLSETSESVDKLLAALELPAEPKLIIILQEDTGFKVCSLTGTRVCVNVCVSVCMFRTRAQAEALDISLVFVSNEPRPPPPPISPPSLSPSLPLSHSLTRTHRR